MEETKLRQLFKNSADAYLNTIDESVEQGMSEDSFIKAVAQAINYTRCCTEFCDEENSAYNLQNETRLCDWCHKEFK
jgi:hypothetical protein